MNRKNAKRHPSVYVCYRHHDSPGYADCIAQACRRRFGKDNVYFDPDTEIGEDFVIRLRDELSRSDTLIVIMGDQWTSKENLRRLHDNNDYVRAEIRSALSSGMRVLPVLVRSARVPTEEELPEDIRQFSRRQALRVHDLSDEQIDNLLTVVGVRRVRPLWIGLKVWGSAAAGLSVAVLIPTVIMQPGAEGREWTFLATSGLSSLISYFLLLFVILDILSPWFRIIRGRRLGTAIAGSLGAAAAGIMETALYQGHWIRSSSQDAVSIVLRTIFITLAVVLAFRLETDARTIAFRSSVKIVLYVALGAIVGAAVTLIITGMTNAGESRWVGSAIIDAAMTYSLVAYAVLRGTHSALNRTQSIYVAVSIWLAMYLFGVVIGFLPKLFFVDPVIHSIVYAARYGLIGGIIGAFFERALNERRRRSEEFPGSTGVIASRG